MKIEEKINVKKLLLNQKRTKKNWIAYLII